jgi:transcriptional regulator with XRE-family HTH domain
MAKNTVSENLGQRIRRIRKMRGLSQSGLEKKSGIKREYISKLETNDLKNPTRDTLIKLAKALEITLGQLIEGEVEPVVPQINVAGVHEGKLGKESHIGIPIVKPEKLKVEILPASDILDYVVLPAKFFKDINPRIDRFIFLKEKLILVRMVSEIGIGATVVFRRVDDKKTVTYEQGVVGGKLANSTELHVIWEISKLDLVCTIKREDILGVVISI